jgi:hypothetical protein
MINDQAYLEIRHHGGKFWLAWPLRVVDCPSCGWRQYPTPVQNGGPAV